MLIRKKPARAHALGEPILHENHKRPVSRRDFISAGLLSAPAVVTAPAWVAALLKAGSARATSIPLDSDMQALLAASQCNVTMGAGKIPFICFDLAGGANLGLKHGQYWRSETEARMSNLYVSILRALQVEQENFADSTGTLTSPVFTKS